MSGKISGHVLPSHMDIFLSLSIPHAALHLGNSCEKLNILVFWREQNYENLCYVITGDFGIIFNAKYSLPTCFF